MTAWRIHTATLFYSLLAARADIDLFLDVGSLDGREAFSVESRFPLIQCIAFEPNPRNIALIQQGIAHRGSHIQLQTIAVGNINGTTSFYTRTPLSSSNYGASSVLQYTSVARDAEFATSTIEVPVRRLDSIEAIAEQHKIALWIDVEGAGYQALEGMAGIAQQVQLIHIEVETRPLFDGGRSALDVVKIMRNYGLELIGSNLDKGLRLHQGDMVFLRPHTVRRSELQRALLNATLVERLALQKLALKMLPPEVYRAGRRLLVRLVTEH